MAGVGWHRVWQGMAGYGRGLQMMARDDRGWQGHYRGWQGMAGDYTGDDRGWQRLASPCHCSIHLNLTRCIWWPEKTYVTSNI